MSCRNRPEQPWSKERAASADLDRSFGIFKGPPRYTAEILFTGTAAELIRNQVWHKDQVMVENIGRGDT